MDKKLEQELQEIRHEEVIKALSTLSKAIMESKITNLDKIFADAIKKIEIKVPDTKAPVVNVQKVSNEDVVKSVNELKKSMTDIFDNLIVELRKKKEWMFILNKNSQGVTISVTAKEK